MGGPADLELGEALASRLIEVAGELDGQAKREADPIASSTGQPAPPQPAALPAPIDWKAEAQEVVDFATESFFDLYPRLGEVWTPAKLERTTLRLAAVMEKYQLTFGRLLGKWGPEIMLAVVVVPKVPATYRVIRDTHRELREKKKLEQPAQPQATAAAATPAATSALKPIGSSEKPQEGFMGPKPPPDPLALHLRT
jgi:hypothetical protein